MEFNYINGDFFNNPVEVEYNKNKLHLVNRVFKDNVFNKLKEEVKQLSLYPNNLDKASWQENLNRHTVDFKDSKLFKSILIEMNSKEFLDRLNETFDFNIKEIGSVIWLDEEKYHITLHVDNDAVKHSMQIYMGDEENLNLGTSFAYENEDVFLTLPFRNNFGYIFKNTNKMVHGLLTEVPKNFKRYSLYFYLS